MPNTHICNAAVFVETCVLFSLKAIKYSQDPGWHSHTNHEAMSLDNLLQNLCFVILKPIKYRLLCYIETHKRQEYASFMISRKSV